MKKSLSILLAIVMIFSLTACGGKTDDKTTEPTTTVAGSTEATTGEEAEKPADDDSVSTLEKDAQADHYTYRLAWANGPVNWNPHTWEMNTDSSFMGYLTTPMVYSTFDEENPGEWKWSFSAATAIDDITEEFADKAKYEVPEDADYGRVFRIRLNEHAKWEDGTPINADTYVYSTQQLLNHEMKNYRANTFIEGSTAIYNAKAYFDNDKAGKPIYKDYSDEAPEGTEFFATFKLPVKFFRGKTAEAIHGDDKHKEKFTVDGTDLIEKYKDVEKIELTDEVKAELNGIAANFESTKEDPWKEFVIYDTGEVSPETPWEDVGFVKTGEYEFLYITTGPVERFYVLNSFGGNWIVHEEMYEESKEKIEDLVGSKYGTTMDTTMSYGPYKLASFEKDKQIKLVKNENWVGFHDGNHEGQYKADAVILDIIEDKATRLQRFQQGLADYTGLSSDDLEIYKMSERVRYTDETYTPRLVFATSLESLQALDTEKGGGKRVVMNNRNFRKALSLSFDREKYTREATSGHKPVYYLFNRLYYYNMANDPNSVYRDTPEAKKAILDVYDMEYTDDNVDEMFDRITGRDVGQAKELFQQAFEEVVAAGLYTEGEMVPIEIMVSPSALSPQHIKQQELLQEFVNETSAGTPFEGKIKIEFQFGDPKQFESIALGRIMAMYGSWGGAAFYPFIIIQPYTNPNFMGGLEKINESNGWNPSEEELTIKVFNENNEEVEETHTLQQWAQIILDGKYSNGRKFMKTKLTILAALERTVLSAYQCIPMSAVTSASMLSYKVDYKLDDYHIMYGFGGFRHLQFNYDDAEWAEYVKENNGELNYE